MRIECNAIKMDAFALDRAVYFDVHPVAHGERDQLKISTPMSANRPAVPQSYKILLRNGDGAWCMPAKPKDGSVGGPAKPKSESRIPKRIRLRGCSRASGVDSKEEDVDSTPYEWRRGGVLGAIDKAANWLTGRPVKD